MRINEKYTTYDKIIGRTITGRTMHRINGLMLCPKINRSSLRAAPTKERFWDTRNSVNYQKKQT
jgi:hypothetical protein